MDNMISPRGEKNHILVGVATIVFNKDKYWLHWLTGSHYYIQGVHKWSQSYVIGTSELAHLVASVGATKAYIITGNGGPLYWHR